MRYNKLSNRILYLIRDKVNMSLKELLYNIYGDENFSRQTEYYEFFDNLINLYELNLINIENEEIQKNCKTIENKEIFLENKYRFVEFLIIQNISDFNLSLTNLFFELQRTVGFSITDAYKKSNNIGKVFNKIENKLICDIFVIMPFSEDIEPVYVDHIKKVCNKLGYSCPRADNIFSSNIIMNDVWSLINNAKIVICDCTERNPNVFYELGIAHAIGKNVICITQNSEDIPFDIRHIRYIKYEYTPRGMTNFEMELEKFIKNIKHDNIE